MGSRTASSKRTAPDFFSELGGPDRLLFRRSAQGKVTSAVFGGVPEYTYERLNWTEAPTFNMLVLAACAAVFASTLLAAALGSIIGRARGKRAPQGRLGSAARWSAGGVAALNLVFLVGLVLELGDPGLLVGDFSRLRLLLVLPMISSALTVVVLASAGLAWKWPLSTLAAPHHYSLLALANLAFTWFLTTWNLLGFRF